MIPIFYACIKSKNKNEFIIIMRTEIFLETMRNENYPLN
jgi:hypothetical protein